MDSPPNARNKGQGRQEQRLEQIRKARLATLPVLRETLLPLYLNPLPTDRSLRRLFKASGIPTFKANRAARRGGGQVYFAVAQIEKLLRSRTGSDLEERRGE